MNRPFGRLILSSALLAMAGMVLLVAFSPVANGYVFWTNLTSGTVGRADTGGTNIDTGLVSTPTLPLGVAGSQAFVYWCDYGSSGTIGRAITDGSSPNNSLVTGCDWPAGVAVDGNFVYWSNENSGSGTTIGRAALDGSSPNQSWISGIGPGLTGVTVDSAFIYWTNYTNTSGSTIGRAKLDGSAVENSWISGCTGPADLAVDGTYIYWSNRGTDTVGRANLDGSVPNPGWLSGVSGCWGVGVDSSYIYICLPGYVARANLDGSGLNATWITHDGAQRGIAVTGTNTPVTLISFKARQLPAQVRVQWETGTELETAGFHVWRADSQNKDFIRVSSEMIPAEGGPVQGAEYQWLDTTALAGAMYWYKLEDVAYNGLSMYHGPVKAQGKKPGSPRGN